MVLNFRRLNGSVEAVDEFRRNLTRLKPELENLIEFGGTKVIAIYTYFINYYFFNLLGI